MEGILTGATLGVFVGENDGAHESELDDKIVCSTLDIGSFEGAKVGRWVGTLVGYLEGLCDGPFDGVLDGAEDGSTDGSNVGW